MLEAVTRAFSRDYTVIDNGQELGYIMQSAWREKATLELDGYSYTMYHNGVMGGNYCLELEGQILAEAQKSAWQHNYEIECAEGAFSLRRRSIWSSDYLLLVDEQEEGYVVKRSVWKRGAMAELPGLSPVISCFMIWLVLISWQEAQAATTASV